MTRNFIVTQNISGIKNLCTDAKCVIIIYNKLCTKYFIIDKHFKCKAARLNLVLDKGKFVFFSINKGTDFFPRT